MIGCRTPSELKTLLYKGMEENQLSFQTCLGSKYVEERNDLSCGKKKIPFCGDVNYRYCFDRCSTYSDCSCNFHPPETLIFYSCKKNCQGSVIEDCVLCEKFILTSDKWSCIILLFATHLPEDQIV